MQNPHLWKVSVQRIQLVAPEGPHSGRRIFGNRIRTVAEKGTPFETDVPDEIQVLDLQPGEAEGRIGIFWVESQGVAQVAVKI
jgi:hypothetical protein